VKWSFIHSLIILQVSVVSAQISINGSQFAQWLASGIDFIHFDVRGVPAVDSIIYPCFYTPDVRTSLKKISCSKRILISCVDSSCAQPAVSDIIGDGFSADSVFTIATPTITGKRPASDTIPLSFLNPETALPQELSAAALFAVRLSNRNVALVDIRRNDEIALGMIPGACQVMWPDTFQKTYTRFTKDQEIILYCASGNRAGQARNFLITQGYSAAKIINFGGFSKWAAFVVGKTTVPTTECRCSPLLVGISVNPRKSVSSAGKFAGTVILDKICRYDETITLFDLSGRALAHFSPGVYNLKKLLNSGVSGKGIFIVSIGEQRGKGVTVVLE
jgi:rhodanese-related sulfurtransferase